MKPLEATCLAVSKWVAEDGPPTCSRIVPSRWSRAALSVLEQVHPEPIDFRTTHVVIGTVTPPPPGALACGLGPAPIAVSAGGQTLAMTLLNALLGVGPQISAISLIVEPQPAAELAFAARWAAEGTGPRLTLDRAASGDSRSTETPYCSQNPCRAALSLFETLRVGQGTVELDRDGALQWYATVL